MQKVAADIFKKHKNIDKVFVTADGQPFADEVHAKNHAAKNSTGKELAMESFLRDGTTDPATPPKTVTTPAKPSGGKGRTPAKPRAGKGKAPATPPADTVAEGDTKLPPV